MTKTNHLRLSQFIESQLRRGAITFTKESALKALGCSEIAFMRASQRLQKKGLLLRPVTGFYVIIEVEYRDAGGPPPSHYLQKLMSHLRLPYYIGLLSAASFHGATHQSVMETQVVTTRSLPIIEYGRSRIRFIKNKFAEKIPKQPLKTPHGDVMLSSPEATLFDLLRYNQKAAGLSHIATVILEMANTISANKLPAIAEIYNDVPLAQRVGYMLDRFGDRKTSINLYKWLKGRDVGFVKLRPSMKEKRETNTKWSLNINTSIEPDEV
ncbi:MAG TPA: type IV toxin-antitoxin system AbiEi family antitoxin [Pseudobdellovibrionaceae bacterium]|nr:type IV toxin-antitoxin system AbiEi family antitoxin [Pseudobdellovibrionaceae bacterium]